MKYDVIVIGCGPAGLSAAINVRQRGASVLCIGTGMDSNPLAKAELVNNYPGMPGLSGKDLLNAFYLHAKHVGVEFLTQRVLSTFRTDSGWMVSAGSDVFESYALVFAGGVVRGRVFEGESEYLGRGVSYCATCDGMLFRGKQVAVIGFSASDKEEEAYLKSIGCITHWFESPKDVVIKGNAKVEMLMIGSQEYMVDGVFILRPTLAPSMLFPEAALDGKYMRVNQKMETNLPGLFAAGDCTGEPLQVAKAVGEGLTAGLHAVRYVADLKKGCRQKADEGFIERNK